jgi:hypothetical protein
MTTSIEAPPGKRRHRGTPQLEAPAVSQHQLQANLEAWVLRKLLLPHLFEGVTTTEIRRDRLKVVLMERGLVNSYAGEHAGKRVSWKTVFKSLYGEELA